MEWFSYRQAYLPVSYTHQIKEGAVVKNCVILADVVIGKDVHVENMVIDKGAKITRMKEIVADPATPGYIKRRDLI